jgi:hypothetical protein
MSAFRRRLRTMARDEVSAPRRGRSPPSSGPKGPGSIRVVGVGVAQHLALGIGHRAVNEGGGGAWIPRTVARIATTGRRTLEKSDFRRARARSRLGSGAHRPGWRYSAARVGVRVGLCGVGVGVGVGIRKGVYGYRPPGVGQDVVEADPWHSSVPSLGGAGARATRRRTTVGPRTRLSRMSPGHRLFSTAVGSAPWLDV